MRPVKGKDTGQEQQSVVPVKHNRQDHQSKDDSARKSRGVKINGVGLGDVSEVDEERQTTVSEVKGSEQKYIRTVITRKQKNFPIVKQTT